MYEMDENVELIKLKTGQTRVCLTVIFTDKGRIKMKGKLYRFIGLNLLILMAMLLLIGCSFVAIQRSDLNQEKSSFSSSESDQSSVVKMAQASTEVGLDDLKLAGIKVYDPEERVKSVLGKPLKTETIFIDSVNREGSRLYYDNVIVEILDKTGVIRITTDSADYSTVRGLKVGDPLEKVYQLYGERELNENNEIHYTFGKDDFDVFMVKINDGKVCLISVYLTC